eukprot:5832707-Pyramimonas_sp.AAC.1
MGCGHTDNHRGVGIVVHRRWVHQVQAFHPVNERIAYVDVGSGRHRFRVVTAYFPHGGYADKHVQQVYDILKCISQEAQKEKRMMIIGTDCNAKVGQQTEEDAKRVVGQYAYGDTNVRGLWLKQWAASTRLRILNTFFYKHDHQLYTYISPQRDKKQLDYFLASKPVWATVRDCEAVLDLDLGSDHRALRLQLSLPLAPERKETTTKRSPKSKNNIPKWPPCSIDSY